MRVLFVPAALALALGGCAEGQKLEQEVQPKQTSTIELTGRVVDAADILSPVFEDTLTSKLEKLEEDTLVQLVVATMPDLEGNSIEKYSLNLANTWGLGSSERDDGLLVLVAPNERKVRIEVGIGLEASVKNEEAAFIIHDVMLPKFSEGQFEAGVDRLIKEVTPYELKEAA